MLSATPTASDQLCFHDSGHGHDGVCAGWPRRFLRLGPFAFRGHLSGSSGRCRASLLSKGARAIILALRELLSGGLRRCSLPSILGLQQRGEALPLEEPIARAALEALAMEVPTGRNVKESQNRSLIPILHHGDAFVAGIHHRSAIILVGGRPWV